MRINVRKSIWTSTHLIIMKKTAATIIVMILFIALFSFAVPELILYNAKAKRFAASDSYASYSELFPESARPTEEAYEAEKAEFASYPNYSMYILLAIGTIGSLLVYLLGYKRRKVIYCGLTVLFTLLITMVFAEIGMPILDADYIYFKPGFEYMFGYVLGGFAVFNFLLTVLGTFAFKQ